MLTGDNRGNREQAYTLIEILIVCAIIGIVMTMSIPMLYYKLHPDSMKAAVENMMEACSHARASAILNASPIDLVIRAGNPGEPTTLSIQAATYAKPAFAGEEVESPSVSGEDWRMPERRAGPSAGNAPINFSAKIPDSVAFELMEVNFQDAMEYEQVRVRFYPNGTSDEFKCLLFRPATNERRLITVEVVTGLADLETDPQKMNLK
jgi:prepilin-type N-terminal cleavage/methylation domain-containing protein